MRVKLKGSVMKNDIADLYRRWGYDENCCPRDVEEAVERCPEGEELVIQLSSPGGSVYAGFEMYTILRQHKGRTVAEVYGIAGSAASVIVAACDEVRMSPVANIMIHRSTTGAEGNSEVMEETRQMLDTIDESILCAYVEKVGGKTTREELKGYMEQETFFTAQQAVELGLADGILSRPIGKKEADPEMAVACAKAMAAELHYPTVEELMAREAEANMRTPNTPEKQARGDTKQNRSEGMEINNVEELKAQYPELTAELCRAATESAKQEVADAVEHAVTAERERLAAIDSVAVAGFEELVANAKADPAQNAGTVAMAIVKAQKEQGTAYLAALKRDAQAANAVPASEPEDKREETPEEAARAAVQGYFGVKEDK